MDSPKQMMGPYTRSLPSPRRSHADLRARGRRHQYQRSLDLTDRDRVDRVSDRRDDLPARSTSRVILAVSSRADHGARRRPPDVSRAGREPASVTTRSRRRGPQLIGQAPSHAAPATTTAPCRCGTSRRGACDSRRGSCGDERRGGHRRSRWAESRDATDVLLILADATSFNGFDKSPALAGRDPAPIVPRCHRLAGRSTWESSRPRRHRSPGAPSTRVTLQLGPAGGTDVPTDERIGAGTEGSAPRRAVVRLRTLFAAASSRPGRKPANLQGIWNDQVRPVELDIHAELNAEMNYWPVETAQPGRAPRAAANFIADSR